MVQLLKEQNKYDQMPSALCDWLQRILPFAKKVVDAVITKETQILKPISIPSTLMEPFHPSCGCGLLPSGSPYSCSDLLTTCLLTTLPSGVSLANLDIRGNGLWGRSYGSSGSTA